MTVSISTHQNTPLLYNNSSSDFYTESRKSWINSHTEQQDFKRPLLSRIEKVIIWKSNSCFPYLNELYGHFAAYYFVGYVNNKIHRDILNDTFNHVLDKSLCYILSSCYFHTLLNDVYNDPSMTKILNTFGYYFKNMKEQKLIYNPLEQIIDINKNTRANYLYSKLCEKMKNEKYKITDSLFVHYLYNLVSFIKILSDLPYLKNTPIYHSLYRLFIKLRKFLLGTSSGLF